MPTTSFTGRCACGKVAYEIAADPIRMINCHCRDCQRASGSAFAALMGFPRAAATLTGEVRHFRAISDRGTALDRGFCPDCGSPVTIAPQARPDVIFVYAASLDAPERFTPVANIFMKSAQPWDHVDPGVPRFDGYPPPQ